MRSDVLFLILSFMVLGVARVCNGGHGPQGLAVGLARGHGPIGQGSQDHGSEGHGSQGQGSQDHGSQGHGSQDHGSQGHGSQDHGSQGHGSQGHGPEDYYHESCPSVSEIARNITWGRVKADPTLGAKLLRVHYHDCFVRGCDASILLDPTPNNNSTEKTAIPNRSLAGFDVIDDIKKKLEVECPGVVSCADITALAARNAVSFQFGKSMWEVPMGRKDGIVSLASEALTDLPSFSADFTTLLNLFSSKGLDIVDLVALSGAHTIGVTHCSLISRRLYNFTGLSDADPSLDPTYAQTLREICPKPINRATLVEMDPQSALSFDSDYYVSLNKNKGIFASDAALLTNTRSAQIAKDLTNQPLFFAQFAKSMKNMGAMPGVGAGEVRRSCRVVN